MAVPTALAADVKDVLQRHPSSSAFALQSPLCHQRYPQPTLLHNDALLQGNLWTRCSYAVCSTP